MLLLRLLLLLLLLLRLLLLLLMLLRLLSAPCGRPPKLTPVALPRSGLRGGLHRKFVQRAVTSEMTGLLALEISNHLGRGIIEPPTGRFPGRLLRGRLPARCRPTSTRLVGLLFCQSHRALFDTNSKSSSGFSFQVPFMSSLLSSLSLNGCNPATKDLLMTLAGPFECPTRFTEDA